MKLSLKGVRISERAGIYFSKSFKNTLKKLYLSINFAKNELLRQWFSKILRLFLETSTCNNVTLILFCYSASHWWNVFPAFPLPELERVQTKQLFFLQKLYLSFQFNYLYSFLIFTAQKMKFSIKDFFGICDRITDLVTFTEEVFNGKLHFFAQCFSGICFDQFI